MLKNTSVIPKIKNSKELVILATVVNCDAGNTGLHWVLKAGAGLKRFPSLSSRVAPISITRLVWQSSITNQILKTIRYVVIVA